jgi:hypothetical protein
MGDVREHVPDAVGALGRVHELLAPGGVLWLAVPNAAVPRRVLWGRAGGR